MIPLATPETAQQLRDPLAHAMVRVVREVLVSTPCTDGKPPVSYVYVTVEVPA